MKCDEYAFEDSVYYVQTDRLLRICVVEPYLGVEFATIHLSAKRRDSMMNLASKIATDFSTP